MLTALLPLLLAHAAQADTPDRPWLYTHAAVGGGAWPSGAQLDLRLQARTPLYTTGSFLLADNLAGVGVRAALTPAYLLAGPRLTFAPAAFFTMDASANVQRYFHTPFGPLAFDQIDSGKPDAARAARGDESFADTALTATVEPTLQAQAGPVVAFDAWTVEARHMDRPAGQAAPYVYEPFWDLVVAWDDVVIEQQGAVLGMIWKGDHHERKLWIGATVRHHWAVQSTDSSLVVGGVVLFNPGRTFLGGPDLIVQVLPYVLDDADMRAGPPNVQAQIGWDLNSPFRK